MQFSNLKAFEARVTLCGEFHVNFLCQRIMEIAADIDDFKRRIFSARRKAGAVSGVFFKVRGNLPMVLSVKN